MTRRNSQIETKKRNILSNSNEGLPDNDSIRRALEPFGLVLTVSQADAIRRYMSILLAWNQQVNLTAITDPLQVLARHFGESFFAVRAVPVLGGRLADFGSGAGFPGLALKLAVPDLQVALIEANAKKAIFLAEVKRQLGLTGVEILRCRLEEARLDPNSLDFISARAFGDLERLISAAHGLLRPGGSIVLWLGQGDALHAGRTKGWLWREPLLIPGSQKRVLLIGQPVQPS